jgi:hypothetical protein
MDSVKYELKLFFQDDSDVATEAFIPVFHRWIQTQRLDELLIDVADYRHVHHGPAVVLVAHDAHYVIDLEAGRPGLLYSRRRETHPHREALVNVPERLASVFQSVLTACQALEEESAFSGRLRFRTDELLLRVNDRLVAPNIPEACDDLRQDLAPFLASLYGVPVSLMQRPEEASRLTVHIDAADAPAIGTLLMRLEALPATKALAGQS